MHDIGPSFNIYRVMKSIFFEFVWISYRAIYSIVASSNWAKIMDVMDEFGISNFEMDPFMPLSAS